MPRLVGSYQACEPDYSREVDWATCRPSWVAPVIDVTLKLSR